MLSAGGRPLLIPMVRYSSDTRSRPHLLSEGAAVVCLRSTRRQHSLHARPATRAARLRIINGGLARPTASTTRLLLDGGLSLSLGSGGLGRLGDDGGAPLGRLVL